MNVDNEKVTETPSRSMQMTIGQMLTATLGVGLFLAAARLYLFTAYSPRGLLIAAVMAVVGVTVGRVVAEAGSATPKRVLFIVCFAFYGAVASGRVINGEPLTMWVLLCATGALMIGILIGPHTYEG